jgi:hypothetical protein
MLYQPFPTTGVLFQHLDLNKSQLAGLTGGESDAVYAYIMSSVVLDGDTLRQKGTGPNFQGGYITLCTCKHRMRTSLPSDEWPNKWVAGFTSVRCGGRHCLFYLAQVKNAHESQAELWYSDALPKRTRREKSASYSKLGDLYEPKPELDSMTRFDPGHYHPPIAGHRHHTHACDNGWRIDIDYSRKRLKLKAKRAASLLVGDPRFSFLWSKPLLYVSGSWRQTIYGTLDEFFQDLNEAPSRERVSWRGR